MLANGITLGDLSREETLQYGVLAEEQGLESVWIGESWGTASVPLLTQLLERTEETVDASVPPTRQPKRPDVSIDLAMLVPTHRSRIFPRGGPRKR